LGTPVKSNRARGKRRPAKRVRTRAAKQSLAKPLQSERTLAEICADFWAQLGKPEDADREDSQQAFTRDRINSDGTISQWTVEPR
jgi:hypothetical protein